MGIHMKERYWVSLFLSIITKLYKFFFFWHNSISYYQNKAKPT